jgi:hypothetical protein
MPRKKEKWEQIKNLERKKRSKIGRGGYKIGSTDKQRVEQSGTAAAQTNNSY